MVLDYIRSSVEIIMSIKSEDPEQKEAASVSQRSELPSEAPKGYEQMLQKLEEEVRTHVGIEQQLKLHIDNLQAKAEDDEKSVGSQLQRLRDVPRELHSGVGSQGIQGAGRDGQGGDSAAQGRPRCEGQTV